MTGENKVEGNFTIPMLQAGGAATFEENLAAARKDMDEAHRILEESEPHARSIEEWLNRRRQSQE